MLNVVFDESAWGSMMQARAGHAGKGRDWDVCGITLALSVGPCGDPFGSPRKETLSQLFGSFPEGEEAAETLLRRNQESLRQILDRAAAGEDLRLWSSHQPDERCGACWLMGELAALPRRGKVFLVELPAWVRAGKETLVQYVSWGEVEPEEWEAFLPLAQEAPDLLLRAMQQTWRRLEEENAPLRAVVNGRLCSVPADFYDHFLWRELRARPEEFHQAQVIGTVLGRNQLGISDGWLALRMEEMIQKNILVPMTQPPEDGPRYHRVLRKGPAFPR